MLSKRTVDTLLDLAENKLSAIIPFDREDMREVRALEHCIEELREIRNGPKSAPATRRRAKREPRPVTA